MASKELINRNKGITLNIETAGFDISVLRVRLHGFEFFFPDSGKVKGSTKQESELRSVPDKNTCHFSIERLNPGQQKIQNIR